MPRGNRIGLCTRRFDRFQGSPPTVPDADVESCGIHADVAAQNPRELDVADLVIGRLGPVDPALLDGDGTEAQVAGHACHLPGVVGLDPAYRHQGVAPLLKGGGDQVLQLADLVAAEGDARVAVLALGPDLHPATERLAEVA